MLGHDHKLPQWRLRRIEEDGSRKHNIVYRMAAAVMQAVWKKSVGRFL